MPRPDSYAGIQVTGLPALGVTLLPGAILARLESSASLSAPDGRALLPATGALVAALTTAVAVEPLR
ncbi:hypothetical protein ACFQZ4_11770 [Catellatospora coxensis]